jgi:hypothetical protein
MSRDTFRRVVLDELLVQVRGLSWGTRKYVVVASLEEFLGREITEAEFDEACLTREAARAYQRRYRAQARQDKH